MLELEGEYTALHIGENLVFFNQKVIFYRVLLIKKLYYSEQMPLRERDMYTHFLSITLHMVSLCILSGLWLGCEESPTSDQTINAGSTLGGEMIGGTLTGGEMSGGAAPSGETTGGEMTGGEVTGGEMTGGEMTGGEVTAGEEMIGGEVTAGEVTGGEVMGGEMMGGEMTCITPPESGERLVIEGEISDLDPTFLRTTGQCQATDISVHYDVLHFCSANARSVTFVFRTSNDSDDLSADALGIFGYMNNGFDPMIPTQNCLNGQVWDAGRPPNRGTSYGFNQPLQLVVTGLNAETRGTYRVIVCGDQLGVPCVDPLDP